MPHPANRLNVIRVLQGETKTLLVTIRTSEGKAAKLGGAKLIMTARAAITDATPLFVKDNDANGGIEVTDANEGKASITLDSDDTTQDPGTYKYDLWVVYPGSPEVRQPVIRVADLVVSRSVTVFAAE